MDLNNLNNNTILELRKFGREIGVKSVTRYRKQELIERIEQRLKELSEQQGSLLEEQAAQDIPSVQAENADEKPEAGSEELKTEQSEIGQEEAQKEEHHGVPQQLLSLRHHRNHGSGPPHTLEGCARRLSGIVPCERMTAERRRTGTPAPARAWVIAS